MSAQPEERRAERLVLPDSYGHLEIFPADQATRVAEEYGGNTRDLYLSGAVERKMKRVGYDVREPMKNGSELQWLARIYTQGYTEGSEFDLDIAQQLRLSPGVVKQKLEDIKTFLSGYEAPQYWVVVSTFMVPDSTKEEKTHQLARLVEVGLSENGQLFSVLEREDGELGYRPITPQPKQALSGLYR